MSVFITTAAFKLALALGFASLLANFTSPEWAAPINTALLILLTYVARRNGKKIEVSTEEVTNKIDNAAQAAAAAAQAAADAARVARDVGGRFRDVATAQVLKEGDGA